MRVLIVSNGYPPTGLGGVETYTRDLARSLAGRGHAITVLARASTLDAPDGQVRRETVEGIPVVRVVNDHKQARAFLETCLEPQVEALFASLLEELQPEVVHFNHLISLSARLPLIAQARGLPTLLTLHDYWPLCQRIKLVDWRGEVCPGPQYQPCAVCVVGGPQQSPRLRGLASLARWGKRLAPAPLRRRLRQALPGAENSLPALASSPEMFAARYRLFHEAVLSAGRILVPSEYVRTRYAANGYPAERFFVLPLGLNVPDASRRPVAARGKGLRFGFVGALIPAKGPDLLLRAFRKVAGEELELRLYGGEGPQARQYGQALRHLAAGEARIRFLGSFSPSERERVFGEFDVLVAPSRFPETYSLAAREALALGKPVIAAEVGALPEVIFPGENGFLFPPGDEAALEAILQDLARQPQLLEALHLPGPAPLPTLEEHARQVEALYAGLLANPTAPPGKTVTGSP